MALRKTVTNRIDDDLAAIRARLQTEPITLEQRNELRREVDALLDWRNRVTPPAHGRDRGQKSEEAP